MTEELKSCPFCGKSDKLDKDMTDDGYYLVYCNNCFAGGPQVGYDTPCNQNTADSLWNTRRQMMSEQPCTDRELISQGRHGFYDKDSCYVYQLAEMLATRLEAALAREAIAVEALEQIASPCSDLTKIALAEQALAEIQAMKEVGNE